MEQTIIEYLAEQRASFADELAMNGCDATTANASPQPFAFAHFAVVDTRIVA